MNKTQKIILSIVVTLILFVIAYSWSTSISKSYWTNFDDNGRYRAGKKYYEYVNVEFYELRYNWYVWILFIIVSGGFNFWLYSDKKDKVKKKDEKD